MTDLLDLADIPEIEMSDDLVDDHDAACMVLAGKLVSAGCLEYEMAAYATAVYKKNEVYYYVSAKEESVLRYIQDCYLEGYMPMPIKYYYKRYDMVDTTEEAIRKEFRQYVPLKLQESYPKEFFEAFHDLVKDLHGNRVMPLLETLMNQLENCFDVKQLNIFDSLLRMLLPAKLLNAEGYAIAKRWLHHEYEKLAIEPSKAGAHQKTFGGFAYEKPSGEVNFFVDATPYMAKEKQQSFIGKGYITTPILEYMYYAETFEESSKLREKMITDVERYLKNNYLNVMKYIRQYPSAVDKAKYDILLADLQAKGLKQACDVMRYYGYLWNVI